MEALGSLLFVCVCGLLTAYLKLYVAYTSSGDLVKMQVWIQQVWGGARPRATL